MGREGNGEKEGEEGAGEGKEHQLIFAIVCDIALSLSAGYVGVERTVFFTAQRA